MDNLRKKWYLSLSRINIRSGKVIGLVVLAIILLLVPVVVRSPYHMHLLIMVGINAVLAMAFIFLLRTGLITLAIAAFWGIGAYSSALLAVRLGLPFWLALPASALITAIIAFCIGYLLVRNPGFGFIILTIAFGMAIVLVFGTFDFFGGYVGIINIPRPEPITIPFLAPIEFSRVSKTAYYYLMLFLVLIVVLAFYAFYASSAGRAWRAIGLSPHLAESLGVNLFKYRLTAFIISSTAAGLMGSFYAHYMESLVPNAFNVLKTIYAHVYAILGGIGFAISGPVVGALIMTISPELLREFQEFEPIFTGLLLILLVLFLPNGLLGLISSRRPARPSESIARVGKWIRASLPASSSGREDKK